MKFDKIIFITLFFITVTVVGIYKKKRVVNDECFSCLIKVESLEKPIQLSGKWLFNKYDNYNHRFPERDISDWVLLDTPGDWERVYKQFRELDAEDYIYSNNKPTIGWYRGVFEFDESLIGQDVIFLVDSYISKMNFYLDGIEIFSRKGPSTYQKFYSIQPIPIKFRVTKKRHTVVFKVDSVLMKGVYQLPFELRKASSFDFKLSTTYFWGSTLREFIGIFLFIFGMFFILVFYKTKYLNYLYAGFAGMSSLPFFIMTSDSFFTFFNDQTIIILHYTSLALMSGASHLFGQRFYKTYPRFNIFLYVSIAFNILGFLGLAFHFNIEFFMLLRNLTFIYTMVIGSHVIYLFYRAHTKGEQGMSWIFHGYTIFVLTGVHDILLALGVIESIAMIFMGYLAAASSVISYVMLHFSNTFVKNKELVNNLTELTDTLEHKVEERTNELIDTNKRMIQMAHRAGMAEIATGILHDIGNVINSIGVLDEKIKSLLYETQLGTLGKLNNLLFIKNKEKFDGLLGDEKFSKTIPDAYMKLDKALNEERKTLEEYTMRLSRSVESVKNIVLSQQEYAKFGGLSESISVESLINDALMIESESVKSNQVKVKTKFGDVHKVEAHKNKLFHVIVNLVKNAIEAVSEVPIEDREIEIRTVEDQNCVKIIVKDSGCGISEEALSKIFEHGYTTKSTGNGFGLHASSNAMVEMGGELQAVSRGIGHGAEFIIIINKRRQAA